jgi:hypothetical protein
LGQLLNGVINPIFERKMFGLRVLFQHSIFFRRCGPLAGNLEQIRIDKIAV